MIGLDCNIPATHLAAIVHVNGVGRLRTSDPGDFAIFAAFEIVTP
jgi:hypothetical protein